MGHTKKIHRKVCRQLIVNHDILNITERLEAAYKCSFHQYKKK